MESILVSIVAVSFLWIIMACVFWDSEYAQPHHRNMWSGGAITILIMFGVWGICKTEQRLDWLEDMAHPKTCIPVTLQLSPQSQPPSTTTLEYIMPKPIRSPSVMPFSEGILQLKGDNLDDVIY